MAKTNNYKKQVLKSLKEDKENNKTRNITFKMEESLINSFKKDCEAEGYSMSEVVITLIKKYLNKDD